MSAETRPTIVTSHLHPFVPTRHELNHEFRSLSKDQIKITIYPLLSRQKNIRSETNIYTYIYSYSRETETETLTSGIEASIKMAIDSLSRMTHRTLIIPRDRDSSDSTRNEQKRKSVYVCCIMCVCVCVSLYLIPPNVASWWRSEAGSSSSGSSWWRCP